MNTKKIVILLSSFLSITLIFFTFVFLNKTSKSSNGLKRQFKLSGKPAQSEENTQEILENSNMISEGSQFGVQYYDEHKDIK